MSVNVFGINGVRKGCLVFLSGFSIDEDNRKQCRGSVKSVLYVLSAFRVMSIDYTNRNI